MEYEREINRLYTPLRVCYGLVPIVAGADKFTNLLTDWAKYLPGFVAEMLLVEPSVFMMVVGVIEIVAGVLVLSKLSRLGAYVVALWLVSIAVNLLLSGYYDIMVRDLVLALGAWTLGGLAGIRGQRVFPFMAKGAR